MALASAALLAAAADPAGSEPVRDHHLFVGAEVMARSQGEFIPVRNVKGKSVLIDGPEPGYRPIRKMDGMSLKLSPKVSSVSAKIDAFETATIFVPTMQHLVDQAEMELFVQNQTAMAEAKQFQAETEMIASDPEGVGNAFSVVGSGSGGGAEGQLGAATDALENLANLEEASDWEDGLVMGADKDKSNAVNLSFRLSSDAAIADAYVVAMVRIWAEERFVDLTLFNHLGRVDATPRRVTLVQRDLPSGLEIKETEVYLFSRGVEIPTNLSPKHMRITEAEAREFVKLSHLGDHRGGEVPALPALENGSPVASALTVNPADFFADRR